MMYRAIQLSFVFVATVCFASPENQDTKHSIGARKLVSARGICAKCISSDCFPDGKRMIPDECSQEYGCFGDVNCKPYQCGKCEREGCYGPTPDSSRCSRFGCTMIKANCMERICRKCVGCNDQNRASSKCKKCESYGCKTIQTDERKNPCEGSLDVDACESKGCSRCEKKGCGPNGSSPDSLCIAKLYCDKYDCTKLLDPCSQCKRCLASGIKDGKCLNNCDICQKERACKNCKKCEAAKGVNNRRCNKPCGICAANVSKETEPATDCDVCNNCKANSTKSRTCRKACQGCVSNSEDEEENTKPKLDNPCDACTKCWESGIDDENCKVGKCYMRATGEIVCRACPAELGCKTRLPDSKTPPTRPVALIDRRPNGPP